MSSNCKVSPSNKISLIFEAPFVIFPTAPAIKFIERPSSDFLVPKIFPEPPVTSIS